MKTTISLLLVISANLCLSQNDSLFQYFPHKVGSFWRYQTSDASGLHYVNIWSNNTTKILGQNIFYYTFRSCPSNIFDTTVFSSQYVFIDSLNLTASNRINPANLLDSFACSPGDIFGDSIYCDKVNTETVLGKVTTVRYMRSLKSGNNSQYKIAYGFGNVEGSTGGVIAGFQQSAPYKLTYAFINNTHYGKALTKKQEDSLLQYHPFQIGNTWIYREKQYEYYSQDSITVLSEKIVTKKITGDTIINGRTYFVFNGNEYQRYDSVSGNIVTYDFSSKKEIIVDSLSCTAGKIKNSGIDYTYSSISNETILGYKTSSRNIVVSPYADARSYYNYSLGLGLTHYGFFGLANYYVSSNLLYAKINGKEYGVDPQKQLMDSLLQYYPLHTGNTWIYKNNNSYFSKKFVLGDTTINNKLYKKIELTNLHSNEIQLQFERIDSLVGEVYRLEHGREIKIDSFLCVKNGRFGYPLVKICEDISSQTYFGITIPVRRILMPVIPRNPRYCFAYGIGEVLATEIEEDPIYPRYSTKTKSLVYAKINGKEYGADWKKQLMDSLANYHPLQTGNVWIYKHFSYGAFTNLSKIEIVGDTLISGKTYATIKNIDGIGFERFDKITGTYYILQNNVEYPQDSAIVNDPAIVWGGWYNNRKFFSITTDSIFGKQFLTRTITEGNLIKEDQSSWQYAYGIGLIREFNVSLTTLYYVSDRMLVYAKINGKEYGTNPLSVKDENKNIPTEFSLSQNYPNPFNPTTSIGFSIPKNLAGLGDLQGLPVTLKIYDALGREVASLVNENKAPGNYSVPFDASQFSSGMYFYQLKAGNYSSVKKMILAK